MLTKAIIKYIQSLKEKKHRNKNGTFVAEGNKLVKELLETTKCKYLITTKDNPININSNDIEEIIEVKDDELKKVSFLKNPQQMLAVFYQSKEHNIKDLNNKLTLILDEIQDPGNLGTIVRIADWYGIKNVICSPNTADIYNPKTVQATMGALARVRVSYTDLIPFLERNKNIPTYGTFLDGDNIYQNDLSKNGFIIMGNEGNGISREVEKYVNKRLLLPNFPANNETSESLNVAVATAITCAEFRRRIL